MAEQEKLPEHVQYLFEIITEKFSPSTRTEATVKKTTRQIYEELQESLPSKSFSQDDLFQFLFQSGFKCDGNGQDFEFVWLMEPKKQ